VTSHPANIRIDDPQEDKGTHNSSTAVTILCQCMMAIMTV